VTACPRVTIVDGVSATDPGGDPLIGWSSKPDGVLDDDV
jgi:hypothetical protein